MKIKIIQKSNILIIALLGFFLNLASLKAHPDFKNLKPLCSDSEIQKLNLSDWPQKGLQKGLIVFPEQGRDPWLKAINSAKSKIQLSAYRLSDQKIVEALCKVAKEKSVTVEILLEPEPFSHSKSDNIASPKELLEKAGAKIHNIDETRFNQVHYKVIIIDDKWGIVSTGNLDDESFDGLPNKNVAACRDFAVTITNPELLSYIQEVFLSDINNTKKEFINDQIIVGPDNQRAFLKKLIKAAKSSIKIYQQSVQDDDIAKEIAAVADKGIKVELLMMPHPFGNDKEDGNKPNQKLIGSAKDGKVYLNKDLYMHAKVIIIDSGENDALMYIGSANFYGPALDKTRELGVLTEDKELISNVVGIFEADKKKSELIKYSK